MVFKLSLMYNIVDYQAYGRYCEKCEAVIKQYGGRFIATSYNNFDIIPIEGNVPEAVNVLVFPSTEQYMAFYNSPEYQAIIDERKSVCDSQLLLLERNK